ncbi:MATE family efflux transporter, partial [Brachyspira hyodysenteriae]
AALATIIGNASSTLYYIWHIAKKSTFLSIRFKDFALSKDILNNVFSIGFPVFMNNVLISIANILINNFASRYNDNVVAGLGVSQRIFMLVLLVFIGLGQGVQPFIGYNYASKNYKRMNASIKLSCLFSFVSGIIFLIFAFIFSKELIAIFIKNDEVIEYGSKFLIAAYSVAPIIGFQFVFISTFQALGKALPSLILSVCRQGIAFVPAIYFGTKFFGINGIIWSQPIADVVSILLSAIMYIYIYRTTKKKNMIKNEINS